MDHGSHTDGFWFRLFQIQSTIKQKATMYMESSLHVCDPLSRRSSADDPCHERECVEKGLREHVGIHVRRNDMEKVLAEKGIRVADEDEKVWDIIKRELSKVPRKVVHLITDSPSHSKVAWKKFGNKIHHGLCWESLRGTNSEYNKRPNTLSLAMMDFSILKQCDKLFLMEASSITEWLRATGMT